MKKTNIIFCQSKGGVGKSTITKMASYYAMEKGIKAAFFDADNASKTLSNFAVGIKNVKPDFIKYYPVNFFTEENEFDLSLFNEFATNIQEQFSDFDLTVTDMGAETSRLFLEYIKQNEGIFDFLTTEWGFKIVVIISGGETTECFHFLNEFPKDVQKEIVLVNNTFTGIIEDIPLKFPKISLGTSLSDKFKKTLLNTGFTPSYFGEMKLLDQMSIKQFLRLSNNFFDIFFNTLENDGTKKDRKSKQV